MLRRADGPRGVESTTEGLPARVSRDATPGKNVAASLALLQRQAGNRAVTGALAGRSFPDHEQLVARQRQHGGSLAPASPAVREGVRAYAGGHITMQVGNGECSDLAIVALRSAGARVPPRGSYEWGVPLPSAASAEPGDILQFRNFRNVVRHADGTGVTTTFPARHTAIVDTVLAPGHYRVLQQNMAYNHRQERTVSTGEVYVVAQQAAGPGGDTVTVSGEVLGYRPAAR